MVFWFFLHQLTYLPSISYLCILRLRRNKIFFSKKIFQVLNVSDLPIFIWEGFKGLSLPLIQDFLGLNHPWQKPVQYIIFQWNLPILPKQEGVELFLPTSHEERGCQILFHQHRYQACPNCWVFIARSDQIAYFIIATVFVTRLSQNPSWLYWTLSLLPFPCQ